MSDQPPLPKLLADLAEALGTGAALDLARNLGGVILSVPAKPTARFRQRVGDQVAAWLCENYGPGHVDVPIGPSGDRFKRAAQMHEAIVQREGSASELARRFGVAARTVKRHRAQAREDGSDLPLLAPLKGKP